MKLRESSPEEIPIETLRGVLKRIPIETYEGIPTGNPREIPAGIRRGIPVKTTEEIFDLTTELLKSII